MCFLLTANTVPAMLSDRPYMRDDYPKEKTSTLLWLLCAIFGAFVLEYVLWSSYATKSQLINGLAVTVRGLSEWRVWTVATYWMLHDVSNLLHVGTVLAALYLLGREMTPLLGNRRIVTVFAGALITGGLAWTAVHWRLANTVAGRDDMLIGATPGIYGLIALYAALYPNREFSFLALFVPVTLKPKHVAVALFVADLFMLGFYEFRGLRAPGAYAASAHLGGMLAGWVYYRYIYQPDSSLFQAPVLRVPSWLKKNSARGEKPLPPPAPPPRSETSVADPATLRAEVDRILDKINSHGLGSLTADEKRLLDEAKDLISRR